jgi:hypothetical protein
MDVKRVGMRTVALGLATLLALAACRAPQTVVVTEEVVHEVEVTRVVETTHVVQVLQATPTWTPTTAPQRTPTPTATAVPTAVSPAGRPLPRPTSGPPPTPALARLDDEDPGPPFAVVVSAVRAEANSAWKVTGFLRNDGSETYEAIALNATFYDDEAFRHGPIDVRCPCVLLGPGESCPFSVQVAMRRPVSYLLHPDGRPTKRQSAAVEVRGVQIVADGLLSARITGTAANPNPWKIMNPVLIATLEDAGGQIVSLGWAYILQENIPPGGTVPFDVRVELAPFARYQVVGQAERDWQ